MNKIKSQYSDLKADNNFDSNLINFSNYASINLKSITKIKVAVADQSLTIFLLILAFRKLHRKFNCCIKCCSNVGAPLPTQSPLLIPYQFGIFKKFCFYFFIIPNNILSLETLNLCKKYSNLYFAFKRANGDHFQPSYDK